MKVGIKSVLGSVIGASMFCACGPTPTVSGTLIATASEASPLKLDLTSVVQPEIFNLDASGNVTATHKQWKTYVADSQLDGYYYRCLGHEDFEAWHQKIGTGNTGNVKGTNDYAHGFPLVQVAQSNYGCELRATAIVRWVKSENPLVQATYVDDPDSCGANIFDNDSNGNPTTTLSPCVKKGIKETYSFKQVSVNNSTGVMTVDTTSQRGFDHEGNPQLYDSVDIVIRDGYDPNNLRMAVDATAGPSTLKPMALVNISGLNTGDRGTGGKGGYGTAFQVNILTGSTAERLDAHANPSEINFSKNELTSAKELPSPTYDLSTNTVRVAVDPDGYITPSSTGNFKFTVGVRNYVSVAGTEYIFGLPTDGTTCTTKTNSAGCSTDWRINDNILPSGDTYRQMSESEQYDALFTRWQALRNRSRAARVINTSDKSISVPVLTMFPLSDGTNNGSGKLFDKREGSTKLYDPLHASMVVLIRNKASGIQGSDYDSASGVISYQAFQIGIDPPVLP